VTSRKEKEEVSRGADSRPARRLYWLTAGGAQAARLGLAALMRAPAPHTASSEAAQTSDVFWGPPSGASGGPEPFTGLTG
jgi:hypothetical protein